MNNAKTLKLDSSFRPIDIIESIEALVMCIIGKARVIASHTEEITTISESFTLPSVIVLNRYVKYRFSYVACNKSNIFFRDQNKCQYCGNYKDDKSMTLDHILPKSLGGLNTWENLVAACKKCNQKKGNKTLQESGMKLLKKPKKPKASILRFLKGQKIDPQWKDYLWEQVDN